MSAWSRPEGVSGGEDDGYSLYVDITYSDGTNEWGFILRVQPLGQGVAAEARAAEQEQAYRAAQRVLHAQGPQGKGLF